MHKRAGRSPVSRCHGIPRIDSRLARVALVALAAACGACSLTPDYHRPDLPMPPQWEGATEATTLSAATSVKREWWRAFGDPALDALVAQGLARNPSLASAVASVDAARASAEQAGSSLFPSLAVTGAFDRRHRTGSASGGTSSGQSVLAEASYEVDFWGRNASGSHAADRLALAAGADRDTVALTLTASIADGYFQVQSLAQRVTIAQSIAADARRVLALLTAQQAAGVATQLQIEQQRTVVAGFDATLAALRLQYEQACHRLAILIGVPPERVALAPRMLDAIAVPAPRAGLPARILEARPDLRAAEARMQAANFDVGAARAAFFPNLVLTGDYGLSSGSLRQFLSSPLASFAAALVAPVADGGALRGQLHASQAASRKAVADYRQAVLSALADVEDMLSAAGQQRLAEQADREASEAAGHAQQLAEAQYRQGTIDFLSVLATQSARYQADDALAQARLARLQAAVGVFRALGGGVGGSDAVEAGSAAVTSDPAAAAAATVTVATPAAPVAPATAATPATTTAPATAAPRRPDSESPA